MTISLDFYKSVSLDQLYQYQEEEWDPCIAKEIREREQLLSHITHKLMGIDIPSERPKGERALEFTLHKMNRILHKLKNMKLDLCEEDLDSIGFPEIEKKVLLVQKKCFESLKRFKVLKIENAWLQYKKKERCQQQTLKNILYFGCFILFQKNVKRLEQRTLTIKQMDVHELKIYLAAWQKFVRSLKHQPPVIHTQNSMLKYLLCHLEDMPYEKVYSIVDDFGTLQGCALLLRRSDKEGNFIKIKALVSAPWNMQDESLPCDIRKVQGCGTSLIEEAIFQSMQIGGQGRIKLTSIQESKNFYLKRFFHITFHYEGGGYKMELSGHKDLTFFLKDCCGLAKPLT